MDKITRNLLRPLGARVGTFLAGALAALVQLSPENYANLESALTMLALVGIDLVTRKYGDK